MPKIITVTYQQLFPTASFLNARVGMDIQLEEGENPMDGLKLAKDIANKFHQQEFPQMYENGLPKYVPQSEEELPVIQNNNR